MGEESIEELYERLKAFTKDKEVRLKTTKVQEEIPFQVLVIKHLKQRQSHDSLSVRVDFSNMSWLDDKG